MQILSLVILFFGILSFIFFVIKEFQEVNFLKNTLYTILNNYKISGKEDLLKIKNYLNNNITYDSDQKTRKRPLLRHTASQILKMKYGFCGENARVSIKLFLLGGLKANRIYLIGKKWGHVLIEHKTNNNWFMFDGHYDPKTNLVDDKVASINSEDILTYRNDYEENAYLDFCRIKLFYKIKPLQWLSKWRLPSFIIYFFESPYLIKAILSIVVTFVGLILYKLF